MTPSATTSELASTNGGVLAGRVALVTGGTRGIGAAICRALAGDGAAIAAGFSRDQEGIAARAVEVAQPRTLDGSVGDLDRVARKVTYDCRKLRCKSAILSACSSTVTPSLPG